jgi:hypothetical protein
MNFVKVTSWKQHTFHFRALLNNEWGRNFTKLYKNGEGECVCEFFEKGDLILSGSLAIISWHSINTWLGLAFR